MLTLVSLATPGNSAHADGGFFLRVLPDASNEWSNNSKLWVVAAPGQKSARSFTISNTSSKPIDVALKLGGAKILDGAITYDKDTKLKSEGYASFSENPVKLLPNEQKEIQVSFSAPIGAGSFSEDGYLVASLAGRNVSSRQGLQVVIPTVYQYAYPMFIGVGRFAEYRSNFEIVDVDGYINSDGHALRVFVKNTGKIPILLNGDVSFQDATFGGPVLGPFNYSTSRISPGQTAYAAIALPKTITETKWKIYTKATVGNNTMTRIFVKNLSFTGVSMLMRVIQALIVVASLLALYWSWKQFRQSRRRGLPNDAPRAPKTLRAIARKRSQPQPSEHDFDAYAIIARLVDEIRTESDKSASSRQAKVATQRKPVKKVAPGGKK